MRGRSRTRAVRMRGVVAPRAAPKGGERCNAASMPIAGGIVRPAMGRGRPAGAPPPGRSGAETGAPPARAGGPAEGPSRGRSDPTARGRRSPMASSARHGRAGHVAGVEQPARIKRNRCGCRHLLRQGSSAEPTRAPAAGDLAADAHGPDDPAFPGLPELAAHAHAVRLGFGRRAGPSDGRGDRLRRGRHRAGDGRCRGQSQPRAQARSETRTDHRKDEHRAAAQGAEPPRAETPWRVGDRRAVRGGTADGWNRHGARSDRDTEATLPSETTVVRAIPRPPVVP